MIYSLSLSKKTRLICEDLLSLGKNVREFTNFEKYFGIQGIRLRSYLWNCRRRNLSLFRGFLYSSSITLNPGVTGSGQ